MPVIAALWSQAMRHFLELKFLVREKTKLFASLKRFCKTNININIARENESAANRSPLYIAGVSNTCKSAHKKWLQLAK